jgi:hypothetical protein
VLLLLLTRAEGEIAMPDRALIGDLLWLCVLLFLSAIIAGLI